MIIADDGRIINMRSDGKMDYFVKSELALQQSKGLIPIMREIAEPLFSSTEINNFSYLKFVRDGSVLNLTTEHKWIEQRFIDKIPYRILFKDSLSKSSINNPQMYLWPNETNNPLLNALKQKNIGNGCNIYIYNTEFIEVFSFATSLEKENMMNFYVNDFNMLKSFIIYFKEKINNIMKLDTFNLIRADVEFPILEQLNHKYDKGIFYDSISPKKVEINKNNYLTIKEIECCYHLMHGESIKSTALKTGLSPRTIETHLNNAKFKLNCHTKIDLIHSANQSRWIFESLFTDTLSK